MIALPELRAPRHELAALFDGRPLIIADSRLPDGVALHDVGARLCRAEFSADGITLRLGRPAADEALVTIDHAPATVIGLVTPTPRGMATLVEWWPRHGMPAPLVVVAESGLAALPGLLAAVLGTADHAARQVCALEQQVAALRAEAEDLRGAVAALLTTLGGHPPPTPEHRLEALPDTQGPALPLASGDSPLLVEPGLRTAGIASLSLHLAGGATADLAVQVIGAESGRILAAWRVPAGALAEGWLQLETPEPLPGRPETLLLRLAAREAATGAPGVVPLSRAVSLPGEPALIVATLPPGARLVQPLHIDWAAWQDDAPPGIPRLAPCQALAEARLDGPGSLGPAGDHALRIDLPEAWGATRIALGALPADGAAVRCDIALEGAALEARLVLEGADAATGWRVLVPGEARPIALHVPQGAPVLALEFRGTGAATLTLLPPVIFPRLPGAAAPSALPPAAAPVARVITAPPLRAFEGAYPRETSLPAQPRAPAEAPGGGGAGLLTAPAQDMERVAGFAEVVLDARQSGSGWELLDLRLRGLAFRGERWRELKFKFGIAGPNVILEFRRAPSWPRAFETWPGTESDAYGDKFVLVVTDGAVIGLDLVAPGRDGTLVAALAGSMPRIVQEVLEADEAGACASAAARLAERLAADPMAGG
ncbi:DUF6212 domain-containing protein [Roseomonas sp. CECT 9278]|uniref:DUF6212 domain-containing protein n=1 Tax=Roseomonas sp. CECT 9278 TaxID=2845823 RepID=UPI001E5099D0|nr:DUF6212 domain-containing protein [Roseomonas sp. CECT 9278]CAH0180260.1 hypothetical protein ROS9278_01423 [Roseomonas sp. CECT 9278]